MTLVDVETKAFSFNCCQKAVYDIDVSFKRIRIEQSIVNPLETPCFGLAVNSSWFLYFLKDSVLINLRGITPSHRGTKHSVASFKSDYVEVLLRILRGGEVIKARVDIKRSEEL